MKQLRDIRTDIDENLDIRCKERLLHPEVQGAGNLIDDFLPGVDSQDLSLKEDQQIFIEKRRGKHFDALEKRSNLSRFFLNKTIKIQGKKHHSYWGELYSYFSKLTKRFWKMNATVIIASFALFCIFIGWGSKIIIENRVNAGYQKLVDIRSGNLSFNEIQKKVNNARFDLLLADILFTPFKVFPGDKINSVGYVISGGRELSRGLDDILALSGNIKDFIGFSDIKNIYFSQLFLNSYPNLKNIEKSLNNSIGYYEKINWLPNSELLEKKNNAISVLSELQSYIKVVNENFPEFVNIMGHEKRKRYLIVFQNADEIRPTGGFMGSMGLLEVFRGKVQLFQKKDVYAIEWDLKKSDYERLPAPKGINELTENFGLRDANYYANLRDSSETIKFFTDRAGIDIDGVVYINQNILLHLLEKTGPIYFPPLEREIGTENFSELMSLSVEAKSFKKGTLGTPKQVLFDFMEVFSKELEEKGEYFDYLQSLIHDLQSRDIMMWSFDEDNNSLLSELGINGRIDYEKSLDYIYPVYTSLSGNKSDRYIERSYSSQIEPIQDSCDFTVKHEIKSTHNMTKTVRERIQSFISEYELDSPNLFEIQGAATNRQFVRVILPKDSVVEAQEGMEIVQYGSRLGIEFFLDTQLQESSFYNFSYRLKNPECKSYDVMYYKQPGIPRYSVSMDMYGKRYDYTKLDEDFYFEYRK